MILSPKTQFRIEKLDKLGLTFTGMEFVYQDINFHYTDLICMDDIEFNKALEGATKRMETLKNEEINN